MSALPEPQFVAVGQQREAALLGMWAFVAQEVLFFGGLFFVYAAMRAAYPASFEAAHERLNVWIGTLNTCVLLTSSFTMALAVRASRLRARAALLACLSLTAALGCVFLALKGYEYLEKFHEGLLPGRFYAGHGIAGRPDIFFGLYFALTGLHGLHVLIGIGILCVLIASTWRGRLLAPQRSVQVVEGVGLYWHFVDIVWIFLYPLLYLIR